MLDAGRAKKLGNAALMAARDANTRLAEIDLAGADPKTYNGIIKQLENVALRANDLIAKFAEIKAGKGPQAEKS